jgi:type II secretory pathway component GspD/PulD (secretin)
MKKIIVIVLATLLCVTLLAKAKDFKKDGKADKEGKEHKTEKLVSFNFENATLDVVVAELTKLSGKTIEVAECCKNPTRTVTLKVENVEAHKAFQMVLEQLDFQKKAIGDGKFLIGAEGYLGDTPKEKCDATKKHCGGCR